MALWLTTPKITSFRTKPSSMTKSIWLRWKGRSLLSVLHTRSLPPTSTGGQRSPGHWERLQNPILPMEQKFSTFLTNLTIAKGKPDQKASHRRLQASRPTTTKMALRGHNSKRTTTRIAKTQRVAAATQSKPISLETQQVFNSC